MFNGWHQVAFTREVGDEVTPVWIGNMPLALVRTPAGVAAFDAVCPHRGAHLGYGGKLDGAAIVCPFHGHRIAVGTDGTNPRYSVRGYRTLEVGGSIFVLLVEEHEKGLTAFLEGLARTHVFVPGFALDAHVPPQFVIENAFDADHFSVVHGLERTPRLTLGHGERGELLVEGVFETIGATPWHGPEGTPLKRGPARSRFCAHVFSPTLVASELGDAGQSHVVITSATPTPEGTTTIRLSLAVHSTGEEAADAQVARALLFGSRTAFEQDMDVWEHLITDATPNFGPGDGLVVQYHQFCRTFAAARA